MNAELLQLQASNPLYSGPKLESGRQIHVSIIDGRWNIPSDITRTCIVELMELCAKTLEQFPDDESFFSWKWKREEDWSQWSEKIDAIIRPKIIEYRANETFVYMMRDKRNGLIKIGHSLNPSVRERTLQSEVPSIEMFFKIKSSKIAERKIHSLYNHRRVRGEWFKITKRDINKIQRLLNDPSIHE